MDSNTPASAEGPAGKRPRKPYLLTGAHLGNKVQLAQVLLRSGASQSKVAKDLSISRRSVWDIAKKMKTALTAPYAALSGAQATPPLVPLPAGVQSGFDAYVRGDLQRVARLSLENITKEKAEKATLRDLSFAVDKTLTRLEAIEARTSNMQAFSQIFTQYGLTPSHSASRVTLEQKITVETQHTTPPTET